MGPKISFLGSKWMSFLWNNKIVRYYKIIDNYKLPSWVEAHASKFFLTISVTANKSVENSRTLSSLMDGVTCPTLCSDSLQLDSLRRQMSHNDTVCAICEEEEWCVRLTSWHVSLCDIPFGGNIVWSS